ncbi:DUF2680 domain-containing protein [Candidatus Formimonas warabiya]|uniref:Uncharacterized protein n=1 Tax=Formimonas warabiya TaxID=1761012 RepID=A0A3G1KPN6_FORW1|nr:DUF2680 domain-containing protein [Candidatus Formimonas warabiya]ATW24407.1 hypothetical protein DCMF_06075 [Candidatus Formimonas warabiya]
MKKAFSLILALILFVAFTSVAFAGTISANADHGKNRPELTMTSDQKAKMISLKIQMLELKKEIIKQNVTNGTLTQDQAKLMDERINAKIAALKSGRLGPIHPHRSPGSKKTQE